MKTNKENIDKLIKEALQPEEVALFDELKEQNLFEMVGGLYSGKLKWIMILMQIVMVAAFVLFIYCLIQFLNVDSTNELIKWGAAGFMCMIVISMMKLFAWMQIDKNALLREIKRLELEMVSLTKKLK